MLSYKNIQSFVLSMFRIQYEQHFRCLGVLKDMINTNTSFHVFVERGYIWVQGYSLYIFLGIVSIQMRSIPLKSIYCQWLWTFLTIWKNILLCLWYSPRYAVHWQPAQRGVTSSEDAICCYRSEWENIISLRSTYGLLYRHT